MLPTLSSHQDNCEQVKSIMRRSMMTSSFIVFPMMIGLTVVAHPLIDTILTETWLPAVPFLQIFAISFAFTPIQTSNYQALNALGRSDIFLKLEIIKKVYGLIILVISIPFGVTAIAWGATITALISSFVNAYPNRRLLNYSYKEQWNDISPSLAISLLMGVIVYLCSYVSIVPWQLLILQVTAGVIAYLGLSIFFKNESYTYLSKTLRELLIMYN